jgi:LTXXQ motif family protein
MLAFRTLTAITSVLIAFNTSYAASATSQDKPSRGQVVAMDDMKPMQPASSGQAGSGMNMKQGSPKMGPGGMMMDDGMKSSPMQGQEKCQGAMCAQSQGGMMQMMEKMMGSHMSMPGMGATSGTADVTDRIEGRIAFLKAELEITDKQMADWNVLADALRSSRQHLVEARKYLVPDDKANSPDRMERYERHLTERLEAVKSARTSFARLYPTLSDSQKQTADTILVPLIATF